MKRWDEQVDVAVVGSGLAGLTAALAAADAGAQVTVLESADMVGGTSAISGGVCWIPNNDHMHEAGLEDNADDAVTYLKALTQGTVSLSVLEAFVTYGPEAIRFLERTSGVKFYCCRHYPDYRPDLPGSRAGGRSLDALPYEANRLGPDWATRVRRSHTFLPVTIEEIENWADIKKFRFDTIVDRIKQNVVTAGTATVSGVLEGCLKAGVIVRCGQRAIRLIQDEWNRSVGLEVRSGTDTWRLGVNKGVILASGGFEWNPSLSQTFLRGPIEASASPPYNRGDALLMSLEAGADLSNMTEAWLVPAVHVPGEELDGRPLYRVLLNERGLPGSIMVNRHGRRFANEALNYNDLGKILNSFDPAAYGYPNMPAFLVFDQRFRSRFRVATVGPGDPVPSWWFQGKTLAELGEAAGIDGAALEATVARFNGFVRDGQDLDYHRGDTAYERYFGAPGDGPNPCLGALLEPPYYAVRVYAACMGTKGGPRIDARGRVIDRQGRPIPGLFACGNAGAHPMGPGYPGAGGTLGPGLTFGYLAGRTVAGAL